MNGAIRTRFLMMTRHKADGLRKQTFLKDNLTWETI